jgi:hypothetical protein
VTAGVGAPGRSRALRHGALMSAQVLVVCAVLAGLAGTAFASAAAQVHAATERTFGTVTATAGATVVVRWTPRGGAERSDPVVLVGAPPPVGTRAEVAYDPDAPGAPLVPGAAVLATADRALTVLVLAGTVAALVLVVAGWQVGSRRRAARRPGHDVAVRRVRVQAGMIGRSWLETATSPQRFVPVHFDPALVGLASPASVRLRGDPLRHRLVVAEIDGRLVYPSGPVRATEPRGSRTDNPSRPDSGAAGRGDALGRLRRQVLADLPLLVPAPLVALLWTYVDGGGVATWLATTLLVGSLALWFAAVRGSDPS